MIKNDLGSISLQTRRLNIRSVNLDDVGGAWEVLCGTGMSALSGLPVIQTREAAADFVNGMMAYNESGDGIALSVHRLGALIGFIRLMHLDLSKPKATLSFEIGQSHWGQGYATEALLCMIAFAREKFDIQEFIANVHNENIASLRVLEKCGLARR